MRKVSLESLTSVIEEMEEKGSKKSKYKVSPYKYVMRKASKEVSINPTQFYGVVGRTHRVKLGKYFTLVACLKGIEGKTCPICGYMREAWNMINKIADETVVSLPEEQKPLAKKEIKREQISDIETKAFADGEIYVFYATAILKDAELTTKSFKVKELMQYTMPDGTVVEVPAFEIKIKRISDTKLKDLENAFKSDESQFNGGVMVTEYPNTDNAMALGRDKQIKVMDMDKILSIYPHLQEVIDLEMAKTFNGREVNGEFNFDTDKFEEAYSELSEKRAEDLDYTKVYTDTLGLWKDYLEYSKDYPDSTFLSFKEGKGSLAPVPEVSLDKQPAAEQPTVEPSSVVSSVEFISENDSRFPF